MHMHCKTVVNPPTPINVGAFFLWPPANSLVLLQLSECYAEGKDSTTIPGY